MRKNLCWLVLMFLVFASLNSGCGGSSSSPISDNNTTQSQDITPNPPTSPDNTPTPTPNTPTSPDNTPTTPDNPSGEFDMNGTWRVESGHGHMEVTGRSYGEDLPPEGVVNTMSDDFSYVEGSIPPFDISVSKNTDDEYYTVKLSGDTVKEETWGNIKSWSVIGQISHNNPLWRGEFEIGSFNTFTKPEANYYVCDSEDVFNANPNSNSDILDSSLSFRITDNTTITYNQYVHGIQSNDVEVYFEETATFKRVQ